ncbi:hypothetical protein BD324DRAFT_167660 [Kockovaella imperatae]|uniref:Uncharacterized protein n=1 Tax=Kockovaella imperatae TaxID=4999 RepID=A0A1Y1U825_9TREE|nr:hypothetical protein BD324DRAFT_167660 [Kockovaella imperatae]ORX34168.1 hypothetical protein BD324DRAFT_167660 [Kockovaella imperatae]
MSEEEEKQIFGKTVSEIYREETSNDHLYMPRPLPDDAPPPSPRPDSSPKLGATLPTDSSVSSNAGLVESVKELEDRMSRPAVQYSEASVPMTRTDSTLTNPSSEDMTPVNTPRSSSRGAWNVIAQAVVPAAAPLSPSEVLVRARSEARAKLYRSSKVIPYPDPSPTRRIGSLQDNDCQAQQEDSSTESLSGQPATSPTSQSDARDYGWDDDRQMCTDEWMRHVRRKRKSSDFHAVDVLRHRYHLQFMGDDWENITDSQEQIIAKAQRFTQAQGLSVPGDKSTLGLGFVDSASHMRGGADDLDQRPSDESRSIIVDEDVPMTRHVSPDPGESHYQEHPLTVEPEQPSSPTSSDGDVSDYSGCTDESTSSDTPLHVHLSSILNRSNVTDWLAHGLEARRAQTLDAQKARLTNRKRPRPLYRDESGVREKEPGIPQSGNRIRSPSDGARASPSGPRPSGSFSDSVDSLKQAETQTRTRDLRPFKVHFGPEVSAGRPSAEPLSTGALTLDDKGSGGIDATASRPLPMDTQASSIAPSPKFKGKGKAKAIEYTQESVEEYIGPKSAFSSPSDSPSDSDPEEVAVQLALERSIQDSPNRSGFEVAQGDEAGPSTGPGTRSQTARDPFGFLHHSLESEQSVFRTAGRGVANLPEAEQATFNWFYWGWSDTSDPPSSRNDTSRDPLWLILDPPDWRDNLLRRFGHNLFESGVQYALEPWQEPLPVPSVNVIPATPVEMTIPTLPDDQWLGVPRSDSSGRLKRRSSWHGRTESLLPSIINSDIGTDVTTLPEDRWTASVTSVEDTIKRIHQIFGLGPSIGRDEQAQVTPASFITAGTQGNEAIVSPQTVTRPRPRLFRSLSEHFLGVRGILEDGARENYRSDLRASRPAPRPPVQMEQLDGPKVMEESAAARLTAYRYPARPNEPSLSNQLHSFIDLNDDDDVQSIPSTTDNHSPTQAVPIESESPLLTFGEALMTTFSSTMDLVLRSFSGESEDDEDE